MYLDSNVFIFAALNQDEKGNRSRNLIKEIREGKERAATSALTFDEVVWKVKKTIDTNAALIAGKAVLEMQNLIILEVNDSILWEAYRLIKNYDMDPRDSIHAACAIVNGAFIIISDDPDFDRIKELKRKSI